MKQIHVSLHWGAFYYSTNTLIIDINYITIYWVQYSINTIWSIAKVCISLHLSALHLSRVHFTLLVSVGYSSQKNWWVLGATWNTHSMLVHTLWPSHFSSRDVQKTATKVCLCLVTDLCSKLHLKISVIDFLVYVKKYD